MTKILWAEPPAGNPAYGALNKRRSDDPMDWLYDLPQPPRRRWVVAAWLAACVAVGAYVGYVVW